VGPLLPYSDIGVEHFQKEGQQHLELTELGEAPGVLAGRPPS